MLNEMSKKAYEAAKLKGFHDKPIETGTLLMLIVSELSEALEADRKKRYAEYPELISLVNQLLHDKSDSVFKETFEDCIKDTFEDEIADVFIRLFDLCGKMNINIDKHVELKMRYNQTREHKHGKEY